MDVHCETVRRAWLAPGGRPNFFSFSFLFVFLFVLFCFVSFCFVLFCLFPSRWGSGPSDQARAHLKLTP